MGIAVPSQLWKASQQQNMALIGYSGLGLAGYGLAGLGGWAAPLAIHRDGPFLCGNGEHFINGLCKKKRSAEAEPESEAFYGYGGYGGYGLGYAGYGYGGLGYGYGGYGYGKRSADSEADAYYGYGGLGYGYGKRSADSDADAYYGYGGYGLGYGLG